MIRGIKQTFWDSSLITKFEEIVHKFKEPQLIPVGENLIMYPRRGQYSSFFKYSPPPHVLILFFGNFLYNAYNIITD